MPIQDDIPRSRITLTYRTTIEGEPEDIELPLRLLVLADYSREKERPDLEERPVHSLNGTNLTEVMQSMNLAIDMEIPSLLDDGRLMDITLPIESMRSFSPDAIADHLPEVRSLLLMRKLLTELQANISNQRNFRKALKALAQKQQIAALAKELNDGGYQGFRLPDRNATDEETDADGDEIDAPTLADQGGATAAAPADPPAEPQ